MEENVSNPNPMRHTVPVPNSTGVLVLGILSIVGCFCYGILGIICGIIALVLAKGAMAAYNDNPSAYHGIQNVRAGRVCAIIGLILSALYLILIIAGVSFLGMEGIQEALEQQGY